MLKMNIPQLYHIREKSCEHHWGNNIKSNNDKLDIVSMVLSGKALKCGIKGFRTHNSEMD